jgi:hypothetical protein
VHVHFTVHRRSSVDVFAGLLPPACALMQFAEAKVAIGDEGAHAARLGQRQ